MSIPQVMTTGDAHAKLASRIPISYATSKV